MDITVLLIAAPAAIIMLIGAYRYYQDQTRS